MRDFISIISEIRYTSSPKEKATIKYPTITGRMVFRIESSNKSAQLNSFKNKYQPWRTFCQFKPIIKEPTLMDNRNVTILSQVLVSKLPNKALARFNRKTQAKNNAASGPVKGITPRNTPIPNPKETLWGVSFILTSLKYKTLNNLLNELKLNTATFIYWIVLQLFHPN